MLRKSVVILSQRYKRCYSKSLETELVKQLKARIKMNGPLTVSAYMKEVLTNSTAGYYMNKDVFGTKGDFITSPEISQVFGELIGVWCINEWIQCGSPNKIQVVELGPGRGTLADDMLRVFSQFDGIKDAVSFHLVEVSPKLSEIQYDKFVNSSNISSRGQDSTGDDQTSKSKQLNESYYKHCHSKYGQDVFWYKHLKQVPSEFSFYVGHEFFDALPIHKFQKKDGIWREVLVDIDDTKDGPHHLRHVLSPADTAASKILLEVDTNDQRDHIELSPESGIIIEEIASRIATYGGFSLIADYGHFGEKTDTFRAFREHQLCDVFCEPGVADLTADVDFKYVKNIAENKVMVHGPVTQESFLHNMGIGARMQILMGKANPQQRKDLISGYNMLTNPVQMGERFKFISMLHKDRGDYKPAGFKPLYS